MKVICVDDDFSKSDSDVVKKILIVGDDELLPKKGQVYEVLGYASFLKDGKDVKAYILDIPSSEAYGKRLCFLRERFEIYDDTFVPNSYNKELDMPMRVEEYYIQLQLKIDDKKNLYGTFPEDKNIFIRGKSE